MGKFDRFFEDEDNLEAHRRLEPQVVAVSGLPDGSWVGDGVYRMERRYRLGEPHGSKVISRPEDMEVMKFFGAGESVVFLDLETTGLSGGAGTYAFLCGLGIASQDSFNVTQLFLKGPAGEGGWLRAIESEIPRGSCLVTYNGRSFDIPLLRTRHIMARSSPSWDGLPHIDLLHHARRFYRGRFESCSLGSMERNVLGVKRTGEDIPGYLIPDMYLRYLQTRDAHPLNGVFYHNELDIVSLAALYCHLAGIMEGTSTDWLELMRAGDLWMALGLADQAERLWALAGGFPQSKVVMGLRRGYRAKRASDFVSARAAFLSALDALGERGSPCGDATAYTLLEELAKLEEHRFKSPESAMEHTQNALAWLAKNRYLLGLAFVQMNRSMTRRAERLEKILKKQRKRQSCNA